MILALIVGLMLQVPAIGSTWNGGSGGSVATLVQANACSASATTTTCTLAGVGASHTLWACIGSTNAAATINAPTDGGDTFTAMAVAQTGTNDRSRCFYIVTSAESGSVAFSCAVSAGNISCVVGEVSHASGIDATAKSQTNGASTSTTVNCPSTYTTAHANALVFCYGSGNAAVSSWAACSSCGGYTIPASGAILTPAPAAVESVGSVGSGITPAPSLVAGTAITSTSWIFAFF